MGAYGGTYDATLQAGLEHVRTVQIAKARRRLNADLATHAFSPRSLDDLTWVLSEAELDKAWAHPAFPSVARAFAAYGTPSDDYRDEIGRDLRDAPRMIAAGMALYLNATAGGLTITRLEALIDLIGAGGRARAEALMAYMRFLRYIEPDPAPGDGRERRYRPTARMRQVFHRAFTDALTLAEPMRPEVGPMIALLDRDEVFDSYTAVTCETMLIAGMVHASHDGGPMDVFSKRRSGMAILWRLLLAGPEGDEWPARGWFPFSITDTARRAGVARTHVQRLLREGQAAGMLEVDPERGLRVTDALRLEIATLIAVRVNYAAYCVARTLATLAAGADDVA